MRYLICYCLLRFLFHSKVYLHISWAPIFSSLFFIYVGVRGEDAATLREVRFHLDSTLSGLGTGNLDPLCRDYGDKLAKLWTSLEHSNTGSGRDPTLNQRDAPTMPPPPEGVAELTMGMWIHEYSIEKNKEVHLVLKHGPNWRKRVASKLRRRKKTEEEAQKSGGIAQPSTSAAIPGAAMAYSLPAGTVKPLKRDKRRRGGVSGASAAAGVPGVARQLLAREQARRADIARRSQPWAAVLGVENLATGVDTTNRGAGTFPSDADLISSDEDMPVIPGVDSVHAYLAGKSEAATSASAGGTSTSDGEEREANEERTVQQHQRRQRRGKNRRRKIRHRDSSDSDTYDSTSESSTDEYSSEEEEAISPIPNKPRILPQKGNGGGSRGTGRGAVGGKKGRVRWKDDDEAGGSGVGRTASRARAGGGKKDEMGSTSGAGKGAVQRRKAAVKKTQGDSATAAEAPNEGDASALRDVRAMLAEIDSVLDENAKVTF